MSASTQYPANSAEYQQSCPSSETTTGESSYTDSYYYGSSDQYSSCPSSETWDNYRPVDVPIRDDSNYRGRTINYYIVTPNCPHCHHVSQLHQVSQGELYRVANEQRAYQEQLYNGKIPRDYYPQTGYNYPPPQAPHPYQSYYNHQYGYSGGYSYGPQEQQNYGQQQTYTQEPSLNYQSYPVQQPAAEITQVIPNGECEYYNYPPVQSLQTPSTQTVKCQLAQESLLPISSQPLPKKVDWSYTPRKSTAESGSNTKSSKFCWKYLEDPSFSLPNPRRMQPSIFEVLANADEKKDTEESNLPCDQENGDDSSNSSSSDESDTDDSDNDADDTSEVPEEYNDENLDPATLDDEELMAYQSYKISRMFGYDTESAEVEAETDRVTQATENLEINGSTNGNEAHDEASKGSENEQSSVSMNRHHQRSSNGSKL
ncbi:uncharacterized protein CXQ87_001323 [Candidozyma duobushaemuli]|uniref:Uncharacterized protein n=2 Tax=Candidozyma TaxID=3303203 RepID=A0ABX8I3A1_9ASCO|nr:uncharacterized protein CXQ87_001323 [[Candida] duobushaemulonis]PVH18396.1 hypothetical protein CXQ87_001323 [[Candida] duobushaemulonis]QWU86933.1 hypothetical protein CA3LBN_001151 [[Candida] haemuloni]